MTIRFLTAATAAAALCAGAAQAQVLNPSNGHYYQYVQNAVSWDDAVAQASAASFNGWQGYLATVTSNAESNFIFNSVTSATVWAGGTDAGTEGTWRWATGPEAGTVFWQNGVTLTYSRWAGGEPNNCCGGEHLLLLNWSGSAWNDIGPGWRSGYVVEYSAPIPEPGTAMLLALGGAALARRTRRRT